MSNKEQVGARLRAARKAAGFKTSLAFCQKYNIPPSTYSQNESGLKIPRKATLSKYAELLGVNTEWILLGKGAPILKVDSDHLSDLEKNLHDEELQTNIIAMRQGSFINETLLAMVLKELILHFQTQDKTLDIDAVVKAAAGLYSTLQQKSLNTEQYPEIVKIAVETYLKFFQTN